MTPKKRSTLTLPTKMSNHKKVMKDFLKISENPGQFYESLEYQNKRVFQNILFPEGFRFSMKNKECRTSKLNILFDLTSSFSKTYDTKKEKTQTQKVLESHLVLKAGLEPTITKLKDLSFLTNLLENSSISLLSAPQLTE